MSDVDSYILRSSLQAQARLFSLRKIAQNVFLNAEERLYYGLPAFSANGRVLMFYGAYKAHMSICVGYEWVDFLKVQFPQYKYTQATIIFPYDVPFPEDVVQVICDLLNQALISKKQPSIPSANDK